MGPKPNTSYVVHMQFLATSDDSGDFTRVSGRIIGAGADVEPTWGATLEDHNPHGPHIFGDVATEVIQEATPDLWECPIEFTVTEDAPMPVDPVELVWSLMEDVSKKDARIAELEDQLAQLRGK